MDREAVLQTAIKAAVSAGGLLFEHYRDILNVSVKESLRDVVTEVDRMAEDRAITVLRAFDPSLSITTEEGGVMGNGQQEEGWVVDALDGTVNYVNRIPFYCASVAFVEGNSPTVGAIYNPMSEDLYYGAEGIGVFKNQARLLVHDCSPEECLFSVAFSGKRYGIEKRKEEFLLFGAINDASRGCIRTGSAAMNLAYLAEGKLGGCWGRANKHWDVAAGLLLARLAGARVAFRHIDRKNFLVSYLAAVPGAWEFIFNRSNILLDLEGAEAEWGRRP
jgi:myo-inositol-1(or 4)-monophosphatase